MQQPEEHEFSFRDLFIPLTTKKAICWIIFIGLIVYFNALFNGFVWDDLVFIINNSQVHTLNLPSLFGYSMFNSSGYYRPLSAIYFAFAYSLFNSTSFFYHLSQLCLHISNTILFFLLFRHFFSKKLSFFLSLIFLIHPIQVESVSFIAASDSEIFFLFGMIALLLGLEKNIKLSKSLIIFSLLLLSILTKETGVLFLFVLLSYRFIFQKTQRKLISILGLITLGVYMLIRFLVGEVFISHVSAVPIGSLPLWGRMLNIPKIFFYYITTFFFPNNLVIDQQWIIKRINFQDFYVPLIFTIVCTMIIGGFGWFLWKRKGKDIKPFLFFLSWFVIGILLLLQIFPLDMTVADRWFYFPMVGLVGIIGVGIQKVQASKKNIKNLGYIFAACIVILLSIRTMVRNSNWSDPFTLYAHDSSILTNFNLEDNLAGEYTKKQDYKNALLHAKKSVDLFAYENNLLNLAIIYQDIGNTQRAKEYYSLALTKKHYSSNTQKHLLVTYKDFAWLLIRSGSYNEALKIINNALQEYPHESQLWEELAICEYKLGHQDQAIDAVNKARELSPNVQEYTSLLLQIQNKMPIELSPFPSNLPN